MHSIDEILNCMNIFGDDDTIQRNQTAHRIQLVKQFGILPGDRVLEIGCGQGDTTAVLASAVGPQGTVHAVDIASPNAGAPITLGEAARFIENSILGSRITFEFERDFLSETFTDKYDVAVLSHSLFHFQSKETLLEVFRKVRRSAHKICIAEWDITPLVPSQMAHAQAILIQSLYHQYQHTDGNIQLLLTTEEVASMLEESGWTVHFSSSVSAAELLDGAWEVEYTQELLSQLEKLPENIRPAFQYLGKWLDVLSKAHSIQSCNSFVMSAK